MLEGILSPLLTAFTDDGDIDEEALRALVDRAVTDGISALVVAGGTGEFATLSNAERRRLLEVVVDQNAGRLEVVAQTGATSTREAVALSEHAQETGASALMPVTPYYEPLDWTNVLPYFRDIARSSNLPIMAYNYPAAMKFAWTAEAIEQLVAEIPSVQYVKDSSDSTALSQHFDQTRPGAIRVFNGWDTTVGSSLLAGSHGSVVGGANIAAPGLVKMLSASKDKDDAAVNAIAAALKPLFDYLGSGPYNGNLKAVSRILGHPLGETRAPYHMPDQSQTAELERLVASIPPDLLTARAVVTI